MMPAQIVHQAAHWLKNLPFQWEIDSGLFVTIVSWCRLLIKRGKAMTSQSRPDWPVAEARILYGSVNDLPNTGKWLATLTYSFFCEEYRAGEYTREFSNEADAADFARNAKDRRVLVRYHPRNADRSILEKTAADQLAAACVERNPFDV